MVVAIRKRLIECEMIMQGGVGLFSSSTEVTREEWRNFVTYRRVQGHLPGIQALGVARRVRHSDLPQHLQNIRTEGFFDYTISPPGEREEYFPIIFVEPFDVENEPVVGFDLLSEPIRRKTLELAGSTGSCAISEKIILAQDSGKLNVHGFLLCLPIYEVEKPLLTVEERRAALWGYVVAAFHIKDLIQGISLDAGHKIKLEIFDGPVASPSALMLDSQVSSNDASNSLFTASKILDLYGRQWTFLFRTTQVFEAQAAEAANHQKSLFLSNMSHEIRTPMNAILGFAQILDRDPNLSSKQREQIGSINRSGQHLLSLINDILDMSKIEAGMSALNPVAFCLQDLIDDLAMMFRSRAEAKNLQFFVERDANLPYCVLADEGKGRAPAQLSAINAARVAALPADILQAMRQSVDEGDMTRMVDLIDQVETQDTDVAQALRVLADRYDYVRLVHLLDMGGKKDA